MDMEAEDDFLFDGFDFGNIGVPDMDFSQFDILGEEDREENRYMKPKRHNPKQGRFILYDNAVKLAKELRLDFGERSDVIVGGDFIFGDFIEAYVTTYMAKCRKMTISTLSMNQNNIDSLQNLLELGFVDELNLIVSVYFWSNERHSLIPYIYDKLDIGDKFQLAVADIHTKTAQFETLGGRKIVIHGSANLRSSGNIEQFTIEENPEIYDFYDGVFTGIIEKYAVINKPIRRKELWRQLENMNR